MAGRIKWTEERIERLEMEGRGKGVGADYRPWLTIRDLSSSGKSRRMFSAKTGRHHELLSDVERNLFLMLEFSQDVTDIREQYPLPREATLSIAARLQIKHPAYPDTRVPAVMTTDFLVTLNKRGQRTLEAYSCKTEGDLENPRTLEKLELERRYFDEIGIPYRLVLDTSLPMTKIRNIYWIRGAALGDEGRAEYPGEFIDLSHRFMHSLERSSGRDSLSAFCSNFDERVGAAPGTGLFIARALLWEQRLETDLNQPDLANTPAMMFRAPQRSALKVIGGLA